MGGWTRIGIVLSVIWGVGGTLWGRSMILDGVQSRTSLQVDACVSRNKALLHSRGDNSEPYDKIWTPCWDELGKNYVANLEAVQPYWRNAAIFGLAPPHRAADDLRDRWHRALDQERLQQRGDVTVQNAGVVTSG